eukprot:PITA_35561
MEEEYNSLLKNQTWELVPLPSGRKLVRCKWVYRTKSDADGQITRRKTRLVAKGFQQVHGIDYDEALAPVEKMDSIHLTLAIAAAHMVSFRDPVQQQQTKHIEILMHYIRDLVHDWVIDLKFYPSTEQTSDIFAKTSTEQKFHSLRDCLGVKDTVA